MSLPENTDGRGMTKKTVTQQQFLDNIGFNTIIVLGIVNCMMFLAMHDSVFRRLVVT
jgi:hypothetical protein